MTATTQEWPVVERWELFDQIAKADRGCVLVGPGGAGKTTAARHALGEQATPVVIAGVEGLSAIPLGALNIAEMASPLAGDDDSVDANDDLVTHLRSWLRRVREADLHVIVDDPFALDAESVALLADEIRWGLTVTITCRPSQPMPVALQAVVDERELPTIAVEPFDPSMVGLLIEAALGREPTDSTVEQLTALSAGNPMLLREIIRDLQTRDAWSAIGQLVAVKPDADPSERLVELLRGRYPADDDARALLELVAHAGSIPLDLAGAVASGDSLARLVRDGWLVGGETVGVAHPLMAQFANDQVRSGAVAALLAGALERIGAVEELAPGSRLRCLAWALTIGQDVSADELRWGRGEAARRFDVDLACLIADRLSRAEPTLDTTLELVLALAQARRYAEVIEVLRSARERADDHDEIVEIARFLLRFSGPLARLKRWGDPPDGLDRETAAWADAALGTTAFGELLSCFTLLATGDLGAALAKAEVVRAAGIDEVSADADEAMLLASLYGGDEVEALVAFDRLDHRLADVTHRHPTSVIIDAAASSLLMLAGRFEQAFEFDRRVWQTARAQNDIERARDMSGHLGITALFLGRIDDATEAFVRYWSYPAVPNSLRSIYTAGLAQSHALGGRLRDAERVLVDAERERALVSPMMLADYEALTGIVHVLIGNHDEGEARLRHSLAHAIEWQNTRGQLMALHCLCRIDRVTEADVEVAAALDASGPYAAPGFSRGVLTLVPATCAGDLAGIVAGAELFASTGFALGAAETYAAACRVATDRSSAEYRRLVQTFDSWWSRCTGLVGPTVHVDRGPDPLTDRERQIAALAAGGIANPVIAERLGISPRTVENSLHRAFTKLGVTSRDDLATAMDGRSRG